MAPKRERSPSETIDYVITGFWATHGRRSGRVHPEQESNLKINIFVYVDGSAKLNLFRPDGDPDQPAYASIALPSPLGSELRTELFR